VIIQTILSALTPIVVSLLLGFLAARRHDFEPKDASTLNRMAMSYALPPALFVGTIGTPRAELIRDIPLFITICTAVVGLYLVVLLLFRFVFRLSLSVSVLAAMAASTPAVPFMGPAILGQLFGMASAIPIAMGGLLTNLIVVPATILTLAFGSNQTNLASGTRAGPGSESLTAAVTSPPGRRPSILLEKLLETVKEPLVWAPMLAFALVLCGVRVPGLLSHALSLLGQAASGVALFASGIVLAAYKIKLNRNILLLVFLKNVAQPALVLCGLLLLGHTGPIIPKAVLTTAIPTAPLVITLAVQYHVSEASAPSAVFFSVIGSIFTIGAFIALTHPAM
jgi:malonate transporter and related proteins